MFQSRFHIASLFISILFLHVLLGVFYTGYSYWWITVIILVYLLILFLGSIFTRWNFYIKSQLNIPFLQVQLEKGVLQLNQNQRKVALTFNGGPSASTEGISALLAEEGIRGLFFFAGSRVLDHRATVALVNEAGHQIGNYSFSMQRNFAWQSSKDIAADLRKTNELLEEITGTKVLYFRPPAGRTSPALYRALRQLDLKSVAWSVRTPGKSRDLADADLVRHLLSRTKPNSILMLEDCEQTLRILPTLIRRLKEGGFEFTTV